MTIVVNPHNQQEEQELLAFLDRMKYDYERESYSPGHGIENDTPIPEWQKDIVRARLDNYKENPGQVINFDEAMDDIEKGL
jgi:Putative addiction module component